jgi:colicin import membrane protein
MSANTELAVVPPQETALAVYSAEKGLEPWLQKIRTEIDGFTPDISTRKGRDAIASMAYKVARSKTALDDVGKKLVAELKEVPKLIDAERKRVRDTLDSWQEEVRRPLNEWQAAEDARVDKYNDAIERIRLLAGDLDGITAEDLADRVAQLEAIAMGDDWEEFEAEAARAKDKALSALRAALTARQQYEADQAELARRRAEDELRAQQEREAQIAREAEERARREAEQQAQVEREAAARREQELIDQAAAVQRAAEQAARDAEAAAELQRRQFQLQAEQAQLAAEQAEANRIAAERRAEQERIAAEDRVLQAAEQARIDERRRADAAAAEIVRQQEARERDEAHRRSINRAALDAFIAGGMPEECAKQAITLIAQRKIPAISIQY